LDYFEGHSAVFLLLLRKKPRIVTGFRFFSKKSSEERNKTIIWDKSHEKRI